MCGLQESSQRELKKLNAQKKINYLQHYFSFFVSKHFLLLFALAFAQLGFISEAMASPPVCNQIAFSTLQNIGHTYTLSGSDLTACDPFGIGLSTDISCNTNQTIATSQGGTVYIDGQIPAQPGGETLVYTPKTGFIGTDTVYFFTSDGGTCVQSTATVTVTGATPAPAVTGVNPGYSASSGGGTVVITGTNFTGVTTVTIGGNTVPFVYNSPTQITVTSTPAGTAGFVLDVLVTTSGGTSAAVTADHLTLTPTGVLSFTVPTSTSVVMGASLTNAATSTLTGGSYGTITYSSSNTAVATVNSTTGAITTVAPGSATITATQGLVPYINMQATKTYALTVNALPVGTLSFTTPTSASVAMGSTLTNAATSTLSGGSYGAITYSSSNTVVATVSSSGVITPISAGSSTITATQTAVTGVNAQATQTYALTVSALPVGTLSFTTPTSASVMLGNTLTNVASSTLNGGSYGAITYSSSNTAVATVSSSGVITPISAGSSTITATQVAVTGVNAQATQTYALTVRALPVGTLSFTAPTSASVMLGNTLTNAASSTLNGGSYGTITYSSSTTAVATVSSSGVITAISAGSSTITATQTAVTGVNAQATQSYILTVSATSVGTISFTTPGGISLAPGSSVSNPAIASLQGGQFGVISYSSSNPAVASVSASGVVTGVAIGTVTITATQVAVSGVNGVSSQTYQVTVIKNAQVALVLTSAAANIMKSNGSTVLTTSGGSGNGAISYALSSGSCTLAGNVLTAGSVPGACVVTATKAADATFSAATASVTVTVQNLVGSSVTLSSSMTAPLQGQNVVLTALVSPVAATGTVTFMSGANVLGTATVHNGMASYASNGFGVAGYVLTAVYSGDTITAPSTSQALSMQVVARANPQNNAVVSGAVASHATTTQRFSMAQVNNIYSHVQLLHNDFRVSNNFNIGLNTANSDVLSLVSNKILNNYNGLSGENHGSSEFYNADNLQAKRLAKAPFAGAEYVHEAAADPETLPAENSNVMHIAGKAVGIWTAGDLNYGSLNLQDGSSSKFSSAGLTIGMDMQLSPDTIIGSSIGFARDMTTFDTQGSDSKSRQWSASLYGSYQPLKKWYIDVVAGIGQLNYDNHRWDDVESTLLSGTRTGQVTYVSSSLSKDILLDNIHVQPFGRFDVIHIRLNGYSEQGSDMALTYQDSSFTNAALTAGLTVFKDINWSFGQLTPSFKMQTTHRTSGDVNQTMYYSDLGPGSTNYNVLVSSMPENAQSLGFGLNFKTRSGVQANMSWLGSLGSSAYHANSLRLDVRFGF